MKKRISKRGSVVDKLQVEVVDHRRSIIGTVDRQSDGRSIKRTNERPKKGTNKPDTPACFYRIAKTPNLALSLFVCFFRRSRDCGPRQPDSQEAVHGQEAGGEDRQGEDVGVPRH